MACRFVYYAPFGNTWTDATPQSTGIYCSPRSHFFSASHPSKSPVLCKMEVCEEFLWEEEEEEARPAEGRRPIVTSFQPRVQPELVLFSLFNSGESALRRFLPKSHLSKVIIQDNTSVQRVQEIKLKHIEASKKKVGSMFDQMKKKFLHDQQKKMDRWKKEFHHYQLMLEQIDQRAAMKQSRVTFPVVEVQRSFLDWGEKEQAQDPTGTGT
ncbi:uncharacterized protein C5orf52 homolog [Sceloporus undulatus]|uniref:uncharacterized protein C5orf52 homolog n=1 Tax=Sceloporus undulatus TaxID=8520 RepID=UPI001C4BA632|nr:uncharacterized protein C5orf52 homolog [Sceloporus undulatus]